MANAGEMIDTCFRHQHSELFPELYGGKIVEVGYAFPRESAVGADILPEGFNSEGYVWPEDIVEQAVGGINIAFVPPISPREEPRFQDVVILTAQRIADHFARFLLVRFQVAKGCCGCAEHIAAEVGLSLELKFSFLIHYACDRSQMAPRRGQLAVSQGAYRKELKLSPGSWDPERTAEELERLIAPLFR